MHPRIDPVRRCIDPIGLNKRDYEISPNRDDGSYGCVMTDFDSARPGRSRRTALAALVLAVAGIAAVNGSALAAAPALTPADSTVPARMDYLRDLATPGFYVGQYTYLQCVAASIQMMRNIILDETDYSPATQHSIWRQSRALSVYTGDGGADPYGWSRIMAPLGLGLYRIYGGTTMVDTIHAAARALAQSGRPVGLTVYSGGHAWVLSGVTATRDPAVTDDFTVLTVSISDPLWALSHHAPGTKAPSTWLTMAQLKAAFTPYHDPRRAPSIEGRYVAIVPIPTDAELTRMAGRQLIAPQSIARVPLTVLTSAVSR